MIVVSEKPEIWEFSENYAIEEMGPEGENELVRAISWDQIGRYTTLPVANMVWEMELLVQLCQGTGIQRFLSLPPCNIAVVGDLRLASGLDERVLDRIATVFNERAHPAMAIQPVFKRLEARGVIKAEDSTHSTRQVMRGYLLDISHNQQVDKAILDMLGRQMDLAGKRQTLFCVYLRLQPPCHQLPLGAGWLEQAVEDENNGLLACYCQNSDLVYVGLVSCRDTGTGTSAPAYARQYIARLRAAIEACAPGQVLSVGISNGTRRSEEIPRLFAQAQKAQFARVYQNAGRDYYYAQTVMASHESDFDKSGYISRLGAAVARREKDAVTVELKALFDELHRCRPDSKQLRSVMMEVMSMFYTLCMEEGVSINQFNTDDSDIIDIDFVYNLESLAHECESFLEVFGVVFDQINARKDTMNGYCSKARKAIKYINEHYRETIVLQDIATIIGVTPNYLCYLFKKETGYRIVEYINAVRVEKAKELVRNTDYTADAIGSMTGFTDTAYFCTVFKKYSGYTITEYRNL